MLTQACTRVLCAKIVGSSTQNQCKKLYSTVSSATQRSNHMVRSKPELGRTYRDYTRYRLLLYVLLLLCSICVVGRSTSQAGPWVTLFDPARVPLRGSRATTASLRFRLDAYRNLEPWERDVSHTSDRSPSDLLIRTYHTVDHLQSRSFRS